MLKKPFSVLDPDRFDLGRRTAAEDLWLWRHRQLTTTGRVLGKCGAAMGQVEAAAHLGLSISAYSTLEQGRQTLLSADEARALAEVLGPLSPDRGELCVLARRRSGENLAAVTEAAGVTRPTYLRAERDGEPRIVALWEERGFRFPLP